MPSVDSHTLVAGNHDLHLHSQYSDGWHTVEDVTGFALRWLEADRWVGLSDHSPFLSDVVRACVQRGPDADNLVRQIVRSSPAGHAEVQRAIDAGTCAYLRAANEERPRVRARHGASLLVGLEVEWHLDGPAVSQDVLDTFDYVLAGYHGRGLTNPTGADDFLRRVIRHPSTDIIAHPGRFLGPFDVRRCNWTALFADMARYNVLCEYNLMTPLPDDLLALALEQPGLNFVIGSDTHDFRRRCCRRVMDAWAESEAGGFPSARQFLDDFVPIDAGEEMDLRKLYRSPSDLADLEGRLWLHTRRIDPVDVPHSPIERAMFERLDKDASDGPDRDFLAKRLNRFTAIPPRRLVSLLCEDEFRALIQRNRSKRRNQACLQSEKSP